MATKEFSKFMNVLHSRKFWAAVVGTLFVILEEFIPGFPLTADQVSSVVYMIVAYIIGTAVEDAGREIGS